MKTKEAIIPVESQEEFNRLLEFLESKGVRWSSGGKPTSGTYYYPVAGVRLANGSNIVFIPHEARNVLSSIYKNETFFTVDEFIKENSMKSIFTKDDLKNGMLVKTRTNRVYLYLEYPDESCMHCVFVRDAGYISLDMFNYDLTVRGGNQDGFDIMKVYKPIDFITNLCLDNQLGKAECVYKRETVVEMTIAEIEKKLGIKNLKIIKEKEDEQ